MINYSIGKRIRELRNCNNLSQLQLAINADITPAYLSLLERDEKNPTVNCLTHICNALNITLQDFFNENFQSENSPIANQLIAEINHFSENEQKEILEIIRHISAIKKN